MDRLQATTAVTKHKKKTIIGRLDKIMDKIDNKMEEATVHRSRKEEDAQERLHEIGVLGKARWRAN